MNRQSNPHFAAHYRQLVLGRHLRTRIEADRVLDVGCDDGYVSSLAAGRRLGGWIWGRDHIFLEGVRPPGTSHSQEQQACG